MPVAIYEISWWIDDVYLHCTDTGYIEPDPPVKSRGGMIKQESMPQEPAPPIPPVLRREWVYQVH